MYIKSFRIRNYKSFAGSGTHELSPGFNVILGQNNAGKTALIEALSLFPNGAKPHKESSQQKGQILEENSHIDLEVVFSPDDLLDAIVAPNEFWFPAPNMDFNSSQPQKYVEDFISTERLLLLSCDQGKTWNSDYPSSGMFKYTSGQQAFAIRLNRVLGEHRVTVSSSATGQQDGFASHAGLHVERNIYSFRAERRSLGASQFGSNAILSSDASNLAEVLNVLQGQPPKRDRFNQLVNYVFPSIRYITADPVHNTSSVSIKVWNTVASPEREDLSQLLSESGTGIGQVLAILYILVTSEKPQTIIIDEPNTFLHPGAVRRLFDLMRANPVKHQYIISTHSPDVIAASEAETIHMVEWANERSEIYVLNSKDAQDLRRALSEIGARLSDVFGADRIVWVEGPTEVECFPQILRHFGTPLSFSTTIVPLPNTGDIERKKQDLDRVLDIYERIGSSNAILPQHLAISLDRENLSNRDVEDFTRQSKGRIKFIQRRTLENYFLQPAAIAEVLNTLSTFVDDPLSETDISEWIEKNGGALKYKGISGTVETTDPLWIKEVDAPKLLSDLFSELSNNREEFRKTTHSPMLMQWILDNQDSDLRELADYLINLTNPDDPTVSANTSG